MVADKELRGDYDLVADAGLNVVLGNSRGPETLADLVGELGDHARAATPEEAARAGDLVVVATPLKAYEKLPADSLKGKIVIDTMNYYPIREGQMPILDAAKLTSSELVQQHLKGARYRGPGLGAHEAGAPAARDR